MLKKVKKRAEAAVGAWRGASAQLSTSTRSSAAPSWLHVDSGLACKSGNKDRPSKSKLQKMALWGDHAAGCTHGLSLIPHP